MKQELIQAFMLKNGEYFTPTAAQEIQSRLADIDDSKSVVLMGVSLLDLLSKRNLCLRVKSPLQVYRMKENREKVPKNKKHILFTDMI